VKSCAGIIGDADVGDAVFCHAELELVFICFAENVHRFAGVAVGLARYVMQTI